MTRDEILNMPAGREMDALVAERVMELPPEWFHSERNGKEFDTAIGRMKIAETAHYSTDISAAMQVIGVMEENDYWWRLSNVNPNSDPIVYEMRFLPNIYVCEETIELAICRAALLAVMEDK